MKQVENIKEIQIDDFLSSLKGKNIKTIKEFNELRKLAISKHGFLNNIYRRILYQKLFGLDSSTKGCYNFLKINNSSTIDHLIIEDKKQDLQLG